MIPCVTPPPLCDDRRPSAALVEVSRARFPHKRPPVLPRRREPRLDARLRGETARRALPGRPPHHPTTTPAKAGAQLGGDGNEGQRVVTATSPPGPRPPPGRCDRCDLHDAICRYSISRPQGDGTTPAKAGAQLGNGGNAGQRVVTMTFPVGPRPPPGRCERSDLHHPVHPQTPPAPFPTTPAKAGAQLGDDGNAGQRNITATFPPGPPPSPGWSCVGVDPAIGTQANENAPPQQPRPPLQPRRHVRCSLRYCPPPAATP